MAKVYVFLAEGFEEVEALTPVDLLRRAQVEVCTVSVSGKREVTGARKIPVTADILFEDNDFSDADITVLPGGMPGTLNLAAHQGLEKLLAERNEKGQRIAAICAAPTIFGDRGYLNGKSAVCYPGMEERLTGAEIPEASVVTDGHITTSRGVGTAIDFALELITLLCGKEKAEEIARSVVYR
ncbi:MAG: DJ-1/PfpI family protein [Eubacteriales bacterium]|nr:DJ-1/PfpI family protein [Eubacteriales bacterium]